jgi:acetyl esterase/lipase
MLLRVALGTIGSLVGLAALFVTLWIVVPAPTTRLWILSVGATEWSLWFGLAGLLGAAVAAVALRLGSRVLGLIGIASGLIAMILAAIPPLQAARVAAREDVSISLRRFFSRSAPPPVDETHDVAYTDLTNPPLRLDVYRPKAAPTAAPLPAVVVIHGGGWNGGAKGEFRGQSRRLTAAGFVIFDIDYRLAGPELRFPTPVADVKCAIGWIKRNAASYGADPRRLALLGRSAGANLALVAGYTPGDPRLAPSCPVEDTSVKAVISFYAPVDLAWGYAHPPRPDFYDGPWHLRNYLGGTPEQLPDVYRLASPRFLVTPSSPPTLVLHGERDGIVTSRDARFLDKALAANGVPHRTILLPWATHGFDFALDGWGTQVVEPIILKFLRTYL